MVGWHHRLNGHEFEWALWVGNRQGNLVCCSPWGCKDSDMTELVNWTEYTHLCSHHHVIKVDSRASLVAQWYRIHLPMQETWIWSLIKEDPPCCAATKPVHHNCCACALEPGSHNYWALKLQLLKSERPQQEKPPQWEARAWQLESGPSSQQLEKSPCGHKDSAQPKINKCNFLKKVDKRVTWCLGYLA